MPKYKVFADRREAGLALGRLLEPFYKGKNALVLGIPRGGVEVAYYVADILQADLEIIVSGKLPFPSQPELAFGALTEDGSVFLSDLSRSLDQETIDHVMKEQSKEIQRRVQVYRSGMPLPSMVHRVVILVDDGIATGATLVPALKLCRLRKAAKVVVAVPVSGYQYVEEIDALSDEVVVVEKPDDFYAVGQVYKDFHGLTDEEVLGFLNEKARHT